MKTNALIIFIRNPELGKVKTRLAKTIGEEKALEVYRDLLQHTFSVTQSLECDKFVFYDNQILKNDIWKNNIYHKKLQIGNDLGERMQNAFQELFHLGYKNCIIVGSDLFDLQSKHIKEAFANLESNDVVIGPAEDGGYYLLGLKKIIPALFTNKNWGTKTVLEDTVNNLMTTKVDFLEILNDIDTFEDLEKSNYYTPKKV
ncbi:rSAM/selenodomain-associated transferase 1 [Flavobacterium sp. CG_23.5]|uniref:TIGR04282 family arsenosugar biosynthesis glycosyltransferase n=1 Tax=unclassified Flavobacterium TaxID=196869 RepID=UPI0018CB9EDA|nr:MULTISPECIES: TIGR04282 family arsenosugar biosynthesis glycosyltransferase [unclassified Flavobacterium]MBG6109728.1 rSAM/selenodomain-associated transferase 1 [Flavobacterium sp. CG_9.10]MBP2284762.1 rSAM/selenodomain-associated transferase 1 [Flavobacterium sp. CG_23.5]